MTTLSLRELVPGPAAIDGGLATELEARGHDLAHQLWSARLLASEPDAIRDVHLSYFKAGAKVAISASYQASREGFNAVGMDADEADSLLRRSVRLAQQAREQAEELGVPGPLVVAASVGPYGAIRHDGSEYRGRYGVPRAALAAFHAERIEVLASAGPDILAIETIPDVDEAQVILEQLAQLSDLPAWVSYSCTAGGRTCAGQPFTEAVAVADAAPTAVAVGVNCTAPQDVQDVLDIAHAHTGLPLVVYPNAGGSWSPAHGWTDVLSRHLPAQLVHRWIGAGAYLIGGCCGLGPAAVAGIAATLDMPPASAERADTRGRTA